MLACSTDCFDVFGDPTCNRSLDMNRFPCRLGSLRHSCVFFRTGGEIHLFERIGSPILS